MRNRSEVPPELADAIEFTAEFREAMGFNHGDGESEVVIKPPIGRPSNEMNNGFLSRDRLPLD